MSTAMFLLLGIIFAFVVAANFTMSHGKNGIQFISSGADARRDDQCGVRPRGRCRVSILFDSVAHGRWG